MEDNAGACRWGVWQSALDDPPDAHAARTVAVTTEMSDLTPFVQRYCYVGMPVAFMEAREEHNSELPGLATALVQPRPRAKDHPGE